MTYQHVTYLVLDATGELWVVARELRTRGSEPLPFRSRPFNLVVVWLNWLKFGSDAVKLRLMFLLSGCYEVE